MGSVEALEAPAARSSAVSESMWRRWSARWSLAVRASRRTRSSRRIDARVAGSSAPRSARIAGRLKLQVPERRDRASHLQLVASIAAIPGGRVHVGRHEDALLVVVTEGADREPGLAGEPADGEELVVHGRILNPRADPRVKPKAWTSGVVELAVDGPQDEPRGLGGLAAELLAVVLLERDREVGQHRVEDRRPLERPRRERGLQPATAMRAFSTAWPFASISSRNSARAASARRSRCSASSALLGLASAAPSASRGRRAAVGDRPFLPPPGPPLGLEHAHVDLVPPPAVAPDRFARAALDGRSRAARRPGSRAR